MQIETFQVFDRPFTVVVVDGVVVQGTFDRVAGVRNGIPTHISEVMQRYLAGDVDLLTTVAVQQSGSPGAARAAGTACGSNQIALFVPCHRVVASNGIGGYQFGLDLKQDLLEFEARSR